MYNILFYILFFSLFTFVSPTQLTLLGNRLPTSFNNAVFTNNNHHIVAMVNDYTLVNKIDT